VTLRLDKNSPNQEMVRATLDAIAKLGFYLTHAAIEAEPLAFVTQDHDVSIAPQDEARTRLIPRATNPIPTRK
jgi:hypothetical protein